MQASYSNQQVVLSFRGAKGPLKTGGNKQGWSNTNLFTGGARMLIHKERDVLFSSSHVVHQMKTYLQEKGLSKREAEVVILVVQGLTNKQVADKLCVAEKTVKFHLTNVYKRMKISRRSQIIWTLPMAQFIENAKDTEPPLHTPPIRGEVDTVVSSSPDTVDMEDENTIPIGNSIVG